MNRISSRLRSAASSPRAFSLTEMLVVLVIIVILLGIAIPAFRAMAQSQERTSSEARLGFALSAARDAAINAGEGNDVAAVFTYDIGGPMRVVPCQLTGKLLDTSGATPTAFEVFVPVSSLEPTSLPTGWTVRGYAPAATINGGWYNDGPSARYTANAPAWVFPETGFFNHRIFNDGANRQTFMVRYEGGTGKLVGVSSRPSLVLLPRPSSAARTQPDFQRADLAGDLRQFVLTALSDPRIPDEATRRNLIGAASGDMVMVKPVRVLALTDEAALAGTLGVRVDEITKCLYSATQNEVNSGLALRLRLVNGPAGTPLNTASIGRAIEFYTDPNGTAPTRGSVGEARIYTVDRYSGSIKELTVAPQ